MAELVKQPTTPSDYSIGSPQLLVQLLTDESEINVENATKFIIDSLQRDDSKLEFFTNNGILTTVIGRLESVTPEETSLSNRLLSTLFSVSNYVKGGEAIVVQGGIQKIVSLLRHQSHCIVYRCCCIMSNVLRCGKAAAKLASEAGAVTILTSYLMKTKMPKKILGLVVDCLDFLLIDDSGDVGDFLESGGVPRLVQLLGVNLSHVELTAVAKLVVTLTLFQKYKDRLVTCSAFSVLATRLNHPHTKFRIKCGQAMRNLSNEIYKREVKLDEEVVSSLVSGLPDADPFGEHCRVQTLYNITAAIPHNKHLVLVGGGLVKLVGALERALDKGWPDQLYAAVCALYHLTSGHHLANQACHQLSSDVKLILKCLQHRPTDLVYMAAVTRLIQKLSKVKETQLSITQWMPRILELYCKMNTDFYSTDGHKLIEDITKYCLVVFYNLAKEGNVDRAFTGENMVKTYKMHLDCKNESIVLITLQLMNQLMVAESFTQLLVDNNICKSLRPLTKKTSVPIATEAATIMFNLLGLMDHLSEDEDEAKDLVSTAAFKRDDVVQAATNLHLLCDSPAAAHVHSSTAHGSTPALSTAHGSTPALSSTGGCTPAHSSTRGSTPACSNAHGSTPALFSTHGSTPACSSSHGSAPACFNALGSRPASSNAHGSTPSHSSTHGSTPTCSNAHGSTHAHSSAHNFEESSVKDIEISLGEQQSLDD